MLSLNTAIYEIYYNQYDFSCKGVGLWYNIGIKEDTKMSNRYETMNTSIKEQALNWFATLCEDYEEVILEQTEHAFGTLYYIKYRFHR